MLNGAVIHNLFTIEIKTYSIILSNEKTIHSKIPSMGVSIVPYTV
jgi:hypothetical protein